MENLLIMTAGIAGFAGVACGASADHLATGDPVVHDLLDTASRYLLIHAAAILGIGALLRQTGPGPTRVWGAVAGGLLAAGALCFGGGLVIHATTIRHPLDAIIPAGGIMLMLGWLALAGFGAVLSIKPRR